MRGRIVEGFDGYVGVGFTDSDIKESRRAASDVGNEALWFRVHDKRGFAIPPFRGQRVERVRALGCRGHRSDVVLSPDNFTERDPVTLLNVRLGIDGKSWSATVWAKNLTDEQYNAEWSPGPDVLPESGLHQQFRFLQ